MAKYSTRSNDKLKTCHIDLQTIFNEVVKYFDNSILEGYRGEEKQNDAYDKGLSKLKYPQSKHNKQPSMAVDSAPYPIDWNDTKRFYYYGGFVKGMAQRLLSENKITHKVRWGGDWDSDTKVNDQSFMDLPHFELIK